MSRKTKHQKYANFLQELSQLMQVEFNEQDMKNLVVAIRKRAPVIGDRSPTEVFVAFLGKVAAEVPANQQAVVLQVRQAIANLDPAKLREIVDYIDGKGWC